MTEVQMLGIPSQALAMPWTANGPAIWPDAPADLTFSTLKEIETCPRRWALSTAHYPSIWDGRGYPQRLQLSALAGTIVHYILETITRELLVAGCTSVQDASAVTVLQRLGGLSQVVHSATEKLLTNAKTNPRAAKQMDYLARTLRALAPELRGRVQTMLARRSFPTKVQSGRGGGGRRGRGPLSAGVYCELDLRVPRLGWKGRADLLALSADTCEITDFKTGEASEDHALQLQIYALLWSRDEELNPAGRFATRLVLSTPEADLTLPAPTGEELAELETQVAARGAAARMVIVGQPPEARPSAEHCRYCGVRQLCEAYWNPEVQLRIRGEDDAGERSFIDAELTIERQHGPKSWDVAIHGGAHLVKGLLRTSGDIQFAPGQRVRVLDAAQAEGDEGLGGTRCLTLGTFSEVFVVPSPRA